MSTPQASQSFSPSSEPSSLSVPPVRVLILGAPRTGCTSTARALGILGFHPYVGISSMWDRDDFDAWTAALAARTSPSSLPASSGSHDLTRAGKTTSTTTGPKDDNDDDDDDDNGGPAPDLRRLLRGYDATNGFAAAILAEDLVAAFPAAKVVLTVRDPVEWADSFTTSIVRVYRRCAANRWVWALAGGPEARFARFIRTLIPAWDLREPFDGVAMRARYAAHNARVRDLLRERGEDGRLLEFDARMGWEPLCAFLGEDVPEVKFPHTAGRESIAAMITKVWRAVVYRAILKVGVSAATLMTLVLAVRSIDPDNIMLRKGISQPFTGIIGFAKPALKGLVHRTLRY